ncbi:amino acid ABC transporter permease [Agromyces silvae]|uniref:amino acid ABC transporter permease n=1 Tax=Agromyces silvae TaxID=3388266 RepID=UPI00280B65EC|nr:amino acid ABC transporter permease [Agromyces protaetiae]
MTEVQLFEMRGPRAARRRRIVNLSAAAVLAAALTALLVGLGAAGQLDGALWAPLFDWGAQQFLLVALGNTLIAGATAIALSIPLGAILAAARLSRSRLLSLLAAGLVEVLRALPLLFVVYFFLLALPGLGLRMPPFWQLVGAIVLYSSGVFAELLRAGILALPKGQAEAGLSLGLSRTQVMLRIVFPQVVRALLPALISQSVRVLKETTLGYVVSYPELLRRGQTLGEFLSGSFLQVYFEIAVIFIVLNGGLSWLAVVLNRRLDRARVPRAAQSARERVPA